MANNPIITEAKMGQASYITAWKSGTLHRRVERARERLRKCDLCPRMCLVDRLAGETGFCRTGVRAVVSSVSSHFGEEPPLVGDGGSGTVFVTHCNLDCVFCQNYDISHLGIGEPVSDIELAEMMLSLQRAGCHNVNVVSPSHIVPQMLSAVEAAVEEGLHIPLVFNTGGYDRVDTLKLLDGIVDIYLPDVKFWNTDAARTFCGASDYPEVARHALMEMHRQVGNLTTDERGVARKGMIIRHLIMPNRADETRAIMAFIANELSVDSYVNLMPQYRPCGRAREFNELSSGLTVTDIEQAVSAAKAAGLKRIDR
ncbi:MAG: radical SAM protein [Desulfobacterales bacterium]